MLHFAARLALTTTLLAQPSAHGWRADVDSLVARIKRVHPRPWAHTTETGFERRAFALRAGASTRSVGELLAQMMQLTASLEDGHTYIEDLGPAGGKWFPVRFYLFDDGLWITAITPDHAELAGAKVTQLGSTPADVAVAKMLQLSSADNYLGRREGAAFLANAVLLKALKIIPNEEALVLTTSKGTTKLAAITTSKGDLSWPQYGEIYGPPGIGLVTAFNKREGAAYRDPTKNADLPLHLRGRRAYWWTYLPKDSTVYFALNNIAAKSSFSQYTLLQELKQALAHVDSAPDATTRFILDMRYNSGGDGSLTPAIVNEFVKRDGSIGRRGRLFVIVGRKTFSAAAGTVIELAEHTSAIFVGEPMGVAYNSSGDAGHSVLPNQRIALSISTRSITNTALDGIRVIPVQIPAAMTGVDYFAGRDPAVETILSTRAPYPDVLTTLQEHGGAAARALWNEQRDRYGAIDWWEPFRWEQLNAISYQLLAQKRSDDAIAGFELNTERFPKRWEAWDSLGDAYRETGRRADAKGAYQRALALAPDNWNADYQKRMIKDLSGSGPH
ncbi:MAG TPA: tetratricopeptide repeat protein [Gemmatimonadaceae bacterium]|nr:tetratricopeptide repeat protein [Gemmatimonadaceae bacterium]